MKELPLLVLCGPTAVGKTRLGIQWARQFGLELISADSRQVYKGLDLGTGKDLEEYSKGGAAVPYHLIDVENVQNIYSLFHYQQDCYKILDTCSQQKKKCVLVGGSGLYIESVIRQYQMEPVGEHPEFRKKHMKLSLEELQDMLQSQNKQLYQKTDVSNKKRVVRSLEIHTFSQKGVQEENRSAPFPYTIIPKVYYLSPPREEVYTNIEARVDLRLEQGMLEEVQGLLDKGISQARLNQLGLEYREISAYLAGTVSYQRMVQTLKQKIRHFAKSQDTYFRGLEKRSNGQFKVQMLSWDSSALKKAEEEIALFLDEVEVL